MARFYTPISRYSENSGETYNDRFAQLESGYGTIGNVSEWISSDTLTTSVIAGIPISISLMGVSWRWLRFTGSFYSGVSSASPSEMWLRFNNDPSSLYFRQEFGLTGTSTGGVQNTSATSISLSYGTTTHGFVDLLMSPGSTGIMMMGTGSAFPDAGSMRNWVWAAKWDGLTSATSLQIIPLNGFAIGSYWRLEGMRA